MQNQEILYFINSILEQHKILGLPKHPIISVFGVEQVKFDKFNVLKNYGLNNARIDFMGSLFATKLNIFK